MLHYIDPGTGSMLFTILVGVLSAGIYGLKNVGLKLKFLASGGKIKDEAGEVVIPYAIVTDDKRYWTMFRPICQEMENCGEKLVYMTASEDDPAIEEAKEWNFVKAIFTGEDNKSYAAWNRLKADIVLSTTPSLDVFQWKRSKEVKCYAHIPHAASDITLYRMFGIDYYDAILLSGQFQIDQIRKLEKIRRLPAKELQLAGFPMFDEMLKRLEVEKKKDVHNTTTVKTVLLAPSWGSSSIWSKYGDGVIKALLDTPYNIIVRPHPQSFKSEKTMMDSLMAKYPESDRIRWDSNPDNFNSLYYSDVLISDFSGVLFDYTMVFDKPVIYADTSFDKAPYDACWLDEELWTFKVLPSIGKQLSENELPKLGEIITDCINSEQYSEKRREVREACWCNQGEGAKRIADWLIVKRKELVD